MKLWSQYAAAVKVPTLRRIVEKGTENKTASAIMDRYTWTVQPHLDSLLIATSQKDGVELAKGPRSITKMIGGLGHILYDEETLFIKSRVQLKQKRMCSNSTNSTL